MKPSLPIKDDRVIILSNAESGTAPKLQTFNPADPFGLVARKAKGEKVALPKVADGWIDTTKEKAGAVMSIDAAAVAMTIDGAKEVSSEPAKPEVQTTILDGLEEVGQMFREAQERARERGEEASQFACALWSNGELSLARKGSTLATLSPDEVSRLSKYLKRAMEAA